MKILDNVVEGIAIIGMAGRFPGAKNINDFWENLQYGVESISLFTDEELIASGVNLTYLNDGDYVKASGILENIDLFDAAFFDINPKDAEFTDPQQRLFLECAWEALENAGYDSTKCESRIGVYAGTGLNNYLSIDLQDEQLGSAQLYQKLIGNDKDFISTRVSYKLNLKGPSITVQTACSTSLVATTLAYQSLQSYQCDIALAGGVSIRVPQKTGYLYQQGGTLSPDGHCRAFDAKAQGTTIGNGVGVVVLKRLEDAIADRDRIYAVIKGAAINNDGAVKVGFTAPSVDGQAQAIAEAIMLAEVEPETISYIEAHGTGTALGDPIEIAALTKAFRGSTQKKGFCAIGSVKTNIGHLDAAAGVAGLIKTALALKHQLIPPSLNFEQPNPEIDFANSPFFVNTKLTQWQTDSTPRRAGVSSLGMGGTNAHVVLEEAPILPASSGSRSWQLLLLSAKTESALQTATQNLAQHLMLHPDENLADVAYTLQVGRRDFNYRRMLVCCDIQDAINELNQQASKRVFTQFQEPNENRFIAFMFPGQGSQYADMGKELYETEPVFREQVDWCCQILTPHLGLDLRSLIYPNKTEKAAAAEKLKQTCFTQSALFVVEYALSQLWISWGISPQAAIGHSVGEYVAACLAGVMSVEEALALVAIRGKLMQQLPSGKMLSVPLKEAEIESLLNENLSLAACNTRNSCVVSGSDKAIHALKEQLANQGVECQLLHTSHAFHSQMMEPILEPFITAVKTVKLSPPQMPFISNLTGTWITTEQATNPTYWTRHLRETVRFTAGISTLLEQPNLILLEVGPGRTLCTFAKQHIREQKQQIILSSLRHPKEEQADIAFLLNTLGRLWLAGISINWAKFYTMERRDRLALPTYPFERERYWIESQKTSKNYLVTNHKKLDIVDWFYIPVWKQSIAPQGIKSRKKVLIFTDNCGIGEEIANNLASSGCDVISVAIAEQFRQNNHHIYTINTQSPEDYDALIANLQALDRVPDVILHLWSVIPSEHIESGIDLFENSQYLGFYSLLFLTKSLDKNGITQPIDILVTTNDLYDVIGTESLNPEKAFVVGMCKVIPQEFANIICRNIDIVNPASHTFLKNQLIQQLLIELNTKSTDVTVAYRGHHRWVQSYEALHYETTTSPLREEGVYLITGGLGGIGLELAEYLAKTIRAKLVLTTHSNFPAAETWDEWLATHEEGDKYSRKILKLRSLEQLGAEVLILKADVANESQMQAVIDETLQRFFQINGVIHAAGIKLFKTIAEITPSECEQQLKANGYGLFVLEKVLQGIQIDFCVLISSVSSVVGALGMAAYPAAHHFTDAFIYQHNQRNTIRWVSVNWDNWLTSELAVELASKPEISTDSFITNKEGIKVFERILSIPKVNQIIISTTDLQARIERWNKPKEFSQEQNFQAIHLRPNLSNNYVAPRNKIEQKIAEIWQEILGIQKIGIYDNFLEIGGDSLLSVQITARSNKEGLRFTNQHLFEYPTIAQLAEIVTITKTVTAEQGLVEGELALTPIQKWFFEQNNFDSHHWNQAILLELQQPVDIGILQQVIQHLLAHHDALRLSFKLLESNWIQINTGIKATIPISRLDLSKLSPELQENAFEISTNELQASLNLSDGTIVKIGYFDMGEHQANRLLFVIHHLAVDIGSWRILLDDLQTAYQQLSQGKTIKLPLKTTSFKQWSQRLIEYAESIELQREQVYWLAASREWVLPLPTDYPQGINNVKSSQTISITLSVEETKILQDEVTAAYRLTMDNILLAALTQTITKWAGTSSLLVNLEGNSREVIFDDIDLSRTVGWFTNIAPILLEIGSLCEPVEVLKVVKEQVRNFPNQGLGYGVLKYLSHDTLITEKLRSLQPAEVIFLYLGNLEETLPKSTLWKLSEKSSGNVVSLQGNRSHLLEINGLIINNQLKVDWIYSTNIYRAETVKKLTEGFVENLRSLIRDFQSSSLINYTPSDFAEFKSTQWSQAEIDSILAKIDNS
ncbi:MULTISPECIES: type I polyketide synthase [Nostoc]|uniref:SDR family NAD(P)-dependent oxidoreductase n=1 Tax=Nostoc paludosum FACHB-159 TaxID=2692908 RepID=A0ABR8K727_9NOSO|nr:MULTISPECIES: type I polyketide synthase [Nostoc]MBD2677469.1 SDR family NAD(P)-dependent oxidoreductase [Nostoc sp. FACHB-857]MBD2734138.1 SDR family NAD(P)-dependent oxidoreductase [Nostoc paludosum FACHB-159]